MNYYALEILSLRKLLARWVPRLFMLNNRGVLFKQYLTLFAHNPKEYLQRFLIVHNLAVSYSSDQQTVTKEAEYCVIGWKAMSTVGFQISLGKTLNVDKKKKIRSQDSTIIYNADSSPNYNAKGVFTLEFMLTNKSPFLQKFPF